MKYILSMGLTPGVTPQAVEQVIANQLVGGYRIAPNQWVIVSNESANQLYERFYHFAQPGGWMFIAELGRNMQGWLPNEFWTWIKST